MRVVTLRALADNYIFVLFHDERPRAAVVDPGDAGPVLAELDRLASPAPGFSHGCSPRGTHSGYTLGAILCTHHHSDHVGGVGELVRRWPGVAVYGSGRERARFAAQTVDVHDGEPITVCGHPGRVLEVPGHTRGHLAYFFPAEDGSGDLFSGDTVFGGTIGNLFEGAPATMFDSISKIRALPPRTRIWCAHEYTLQYVREAARIDPDNGRLAARLAALEAADPAVPTVPLLLAEECLTNPFFRFDDADLARRLGTTPGLATFERLCEIT